MIFINNRALLLVGTDYFNVIGNIDCNKTFQGWNDLTCNEISRTGLCRARLWDRCLIVHLEITL